MPVNISSAVIHARPDAVEEVLAGLGALGCVEVHATSPAGKLVVTLEADDDRGMADAYESLGRMDGVLSVALVFHQTESDPEELVSVGA